MGGWSILWRNKRREYNFSLRAVTKGRGGGEKSAEIAQCCITWTLPHCDQTKMILLKRREIMFSLKMELENVVFLNMSKGWTWRF